MKDASILGNLRGMLVDEIHGLRYYYFLDYEKYNNNPEDYYLNYVKLEVKKSGSFEMTITTDSGASEKVNINVIGVMETSDVEDDEEDYYNDPNFFYDSEW